MKSSKISDLLSKISKAIENPEFSAVSKLERDLLKQHIRDLYEEIDAIGLEINSVVVEPVKKETVSEQAVPTKKPIIKPNDDLFMKEEKVIVQHTEPVKTEVVTVKKENAPVAKPEIKIEAPVEKKAEKVAQTVSSSINESIKAGGSLNEALKTSSAVEMHKKLATKPLKELIDLNKKFVLLNELFTGNAEAYTTAITHIDTLPDYEAAQSFITTQLVSNYYWDETKQSTRMFSKLVRMKFGVE